MGDAFRFVDILATSSPKRKVRAKRKVVKKTRKAKGGWSIPLLGIGKKDQSQSTAVVPYGGVEKSSGSGKSRVKTERNRLRLPSGNSGGTSGNSGSSSGGGSLIIYNPPKPSTKVLKRRPSATSRVTGIFSSSGKPSTTSSSGISFSTNDDIGSPSVGSKEYKKQLKIAQKRESAERKAQKKESERQARMAKDLKDYETHSVVAKKYEAIARERRAKDLARKRSTVAHIGRTLYNIASPYNKKPKRRYQRRMW